MRAALVYNIIRFARFPDAGDTLVLCALASDQSAPHLRAIEGRRAGSQRIRVSLLSSARQVSGNCDIVYLDSALPDTIRPARGQLVIGSARNFADRGGMVGLIEFGGQVRFVINDGAAGRAGVRFSSQLLQLAARVIT